MTATKDPRGGPVRRRWGWLWVVLVALAVVGASAVVARRAGHRTPEREAAPPLALPDLAGKPQTLAAFGPGDIVLRFGSVSCSVCDPDWDTLARWQAAAGPGLRIVAVESGDPPALVRLRLGSGPLAVPVLVDASGAAASDYGVLGLPTFVFIDRAGAIVRVARVDTRTGIWPDATWQHYVGLLQAADAGGVP